MDLFRDVNLLSRIAPRWMEVFSSTGFSLCGLGGAHSTIHRLKPVPLDRAGPALERLAVKPAGDFQSDCGWLRGHFPIRLAMASQATSVGGSCRDRTGQ